MKELKLNNNIFCKIFFIHKYEKNEEPEEKKNFFLFIQVKI
jgi:hypothetical protein